MAHPLVETSAFPPIVTVPDDGDGLNAISIETPMQSVANRTQYLLTNQQQLQADQILFRNISLAPLRNFASHFRFMNAGTSNNLGWEQTDVSFPGNLVFQEKTHARGTITAITAFIDPANTHTSLPGIMPRVRLYSYNYATQVDSTVGDASDTSPDIPTYEAPHSFGASGLSYPFSDNESVYIEFGGESGADAEVLLFLRAIELTITIP